MSGSSVVSISSNTSSVVSCRVSSSIVMVAHALFVSASNSSTAATASKSSTTGGLKE